MWCKQCNIETNEHTCPICGADTVEDMPIEIYWCKHCSSANLEQSSRAPGAGDGCCFPWRQGRLRERLSFA